ncbi:unnamed protein product [Linum tenue]|uniref:FACT complex subunit n=1 Tax=Linum tenue TaxID=586396 RepID=A0AAV0P593_9ROSI|nr:unnamed protein product [Linum tenue]
MVFMKKQIHLLCSKKKSGSFELLRKAAKYAVGVEVLIHVWNKKSGDNGDGSVIMNSIFPPVYHNMGPSIVGHIAAEAGEGDRVLEKWSEKLGIEGFRAADVSAGLGDLFVVKEEGELVCVKRAAYLSAKVMNNVVVPKLQKVIDHNEKKKDVDRTVLDEIEEAILQPSVKAGVMLKSRNVDACCHPYFQSYRANDELTHYDSGDVIKCSVGSRYKGYCSYVARSFLVDPNPCQTRAYEVILKAQEAAIAALRPGSRVGAAYVAASSLIGLEAPYLVKHLTKSVGTGIGLELQESVLDLNGTNGRLVKAGMVFNVCLGLENLKGAGQNSFSLLLADTVVVCAEGAAVVTQSCSNAVQDVTYTLSEDSDHDNRGGGGEKEEEKESSLIMPEKESNWRQHLAEALAPRKAVSPPKKLKLLSRPLRSPGLWICHPHFGGVGIGRKRAGALEAHANGFRYVDQWPENTDANRDDIRDGSSDDSSYGSTDDSTDDDTDDDADDDANTGEEEEEEGGFPDIMFANIKLAFYYHTKSPYGLMMHFCLYNQIEVGNKMTTDIQFYVEAVDEKRVFRGEEDGKAPRGPKYLREWMKFVRYVNASCMGIEIEVLDPSLCIEGMLQGSESPSVFKVAGFNLVEMTSLPFLVVKCEDIKMMKFERFDVEEKQQKDFDVLIVLKGLNKDELRIESISYTSLDVVKELLSVHNVRVNLGGGGDAGEAGHVGDESKGC